MIDWPVFLSSDARLDFWTILVAVVCNASCAVLGCFLVLRRMSLLGDAVSHSILAGLAVAFWLTGSIAPLPLMAGALAAGLLTALLTQSLTTFGRLPEDSSLGVVFTSLFAVGVLIISSPALRKAHLDDCILVGLLDIVSLDTVQVAGRAFPRALLTEFPVLLLVLLFTTVFWKELKITSFDPALATSMGLSAAVVHYLLMSLVALTTVANLQAVGAILVVAMLIVPAATAHLLTDRLGMMVLLAVLCGVSAAVFGCLWARWVNSNAAGLMAVVAGLQFAAVVVWAPRYGLLSKMVHQFRLALRIASEDVIALLYRREEKAGEPAGFPLPQQYRSAVGDGWLLRLALFRLRRRRLIVLQPDGRLSLTDSGRQLGQSLVRAHRLWESYLDEYFDLPPDHLHEPAEQIEHFIGPALQHKLAAALHEPAQDPHGRRIPGEETPPSPSSDNE